MSDAHNLDEYAGCSTALARTTDPQTSKDAAKKMVSTGALSRQEKMILDTIGSIPGSAMKSFDFTTKDIAARMQSIYPCHKAYDICRKRFSGLQDKGKIEPIIREGILTITGRTVYERRDGCRVWRLL